MEYVNVIRCDRVRPVPVKDRSVKVQSSDEDVKLIESLDQNESSSYVQDQSYLATKEQSQFDNDGNSGSVKQNAQQQKTDRIRTQNDQGIKQSNKGTKKKRQGGNKTTRHGGSEKNENDDTVSGDAGSVGTRGGKRYYRKGGKNKGKASTGNTPSNNSTANTG
eukprot:TRINITY_DN24208_c0_g1_i3.p2 TRINITY_DN24208_c0_g1~~TRINITY_DN24208_c0_g1_i3.p2  ORF type:complete len:163 (-),score=23.88 TRINITY_DN24208_c0_g1_i3:259-747(-)